MSFSLSMHLKNSFLDIWSNYTNYYNFPQAKNCHYDQVYWCLQVGCVQVFYLLSANVSRMIFRDTICSETSKFGYLPQPYPPPPPPKKKKKKKKSKKILMGESFQDFEADFPQNAELRRL